MAKAIAINWNDFMEGIVTPKNPSNHMQKVVLVMETALGLRLVCVSAKALAASPTALFVTSPAWVSVFTTVLGIADWLCVGVIVFAGATWMFGNRTKALEFLIGGSTGYLIIRHAYDIMGWLKGL